MERLELVIEAEKDLVDSLVDVVVKELRSGTLKVHVLKRQEVEA